MASRLVDPYGHELAWIDQLGDLPDELRTLVEAELAQREFMPKSRASSASQLRHAEHLAGRNRSRPGNPFRPQGRRGHPPPDATGIADRRQSWHPLPDSRPLALDQHSRRILDRFL
jgi:hypothetical protein